METLEFVKIQTMLEDLYNRVQMLAEVKNVQPEAYCSAEIHDIATALAKAQGEFKVAELNKKNPYFKSSYADLESIVQASRPALTKNGLAVIQNLIHTDDGLLVLITKLMHTGGQWIQSKVKILPAKNDIQTISSTITYQKRICYATLLGVVSGDEDDDGEKAVAPIRVTEDRGTDPYYLNMSKKTRSYETITEEQKNILLRKLTPYPDLLSGAYKTYNIGAMGELPASDFNACYDRIVQLIEKRESLSSEQQKSFNK